MRTSDICPTCSVYTNALCVIYNGEYLSTLDINPLDSLETTLEKIEAYAATADGATPNLQAVTDVGAVTTNTMTAPSIQYTLDAAITPGIGELTWNDNEKTLELGTGTVTSTSLGQEDVYHVTNSSGALIADGTPVMAIGTLGASGKILVAPMDATDKANSKYFLGLATEPIANGANGKVTKWGKLNNIDTTGTPYGEVWAEGEVLWVTGVGTLTNVEPTVGMKIPIAFVIRAHASTGILQVRATSGAAVHELNDVDVTGLVNGMHLQYNSVSGNWEAITPTSSATLQTVVDNGDTAASPDTNSYITLDYQDNGVGVFDSFIFNVGTNAFSEIYQTLTQFYLTSYTPTGQFGEIYSSNGSLTLAQSDALGTSQTLVEFTTPTANTTLNFPAKLAGTYTLATSVNNVTADTTGNVTIDFTDLSDTPADYSGQAGKLLQVNVGETAVEFVDKPTELFTHFQLLNCDSDTPGTYNNTVSPTYVNGCKIVSVMVNGRTTYDLGNGPVKNLDEIDGVYYTYDTVSDYWLEDVADNFRIVVTNGTNDIATNNTQLPLIILYQDIAVPGGK